MHDAGQSGPVALPTLRAAQDAAQRSPVVIGLCQAESQHLRPGEQRLTGILRQLRRHFDRRRPELARPDHIGEHALRFVRGAATSKGDRKQDRRTYILRRRRGSQQRSPKSLALPGRY